MSSYCNLSVTGRFLLLWHTLQLHKMHENSPKKESRLIQKQINDDLPFSEQHHVYGAVYIGTYTVHAAVPYICSMHLRVSSGVTTVFFYKQRDDIRSSSDLQNVPLYPRGLLTMCQLRNCPILLALNPPERTTLPGWTANQIQLIYPSQGIKPMTNPS